MKQQHPYTSPSLAWIDACVCGGVDERQESVARSAVESLEVEVVVVVAVVVAVWVKG